MKTEEVDGCEDEATVKPKHHEHKGKGDKKMTAFQLNDDDFSSLTRLRL